MGPLLRIEGDGFHLRVSPLLAYPQVAFDCRPMTICPRSLNERSSQVCVAGFGDAALVSTAPAGVLAGDQASVAHQQPRATKARELAHLSHQSHRCHFMISFILPAPFACSSVLKVSRPEHNLRSPRTEGRPRSS